MVAILPTIEFTFKAGELVEQFKQLWGESSTGYWRIELQDRQGQKLNRLWYLAIVKGKIVFSGKEKLSWSSLYEVLRYYVMRLRQEKSKEAIEQIKLESASNNSFQVGKIVSQLNTANIVHYNDLRQAIQHKLIDDIDEYLFDCAGKASFLPDSEVIIHAPIQGFEFPLLYTEAQQRRKYWQQINNYIPSLSSILIIQPEAIASSPMKEAQKKQLKELIKEGKTLRQISQALGKNRFEVAKGFVSMIKSGWLRIVKSDEDCATSNSQPEIFIVDDSPVLVQQFRHLVTKWGYQVNYSNNALTAVQTILKSNPAIIFLDINMPGASGFDVIKQIRRQVTIANVPLVLLTAEKTMTNQWRAQWANCKFLSKPCKAEEITIFRNDLQQLLQELAPVNE
jgi:CheY-like chemotaxis protein